MTGAGTLERDRRQAGKITTFYSYKGGTGRTMALANVACLLGEHLKESGQKVCIIDWDLEAPGLHRYFNTSRRPDTIDTPGVIDYFTALWKILHEDPARYEIIQAHGGTEALDALLPLSGYVISDVAPGVDMIRAGRLCQEYAENVAAFEWAEFFRRYREVYRVFVDLLTKQYREILIDSRTGLSDVSGVCTMLMPERLVGVFTPNKQSLHGLLSLVERAVDYRRHSIDPRPLAVFPLPSRIVMEEHDLRHAALENYQSHFESCFRRMYGLDACDLGEYFAEVAIPHNGFYGFRERIAVRDEKSISDALSINRAYWRFFSRLTALDCAWGREEDDSADHAASEDSPGGMWLSGGTVAQYTPLLEKVDAGPAMVHKEIVPPAQNGPAEMYSACLSVSGPIDDSFEVANILDNPAMPGGVVARCREGEREWELFVTDTGTNQQADTVLFTLRELMSTPVYVSYMSGFEGLYRGKALFAFAKRHYLAGVYGLPREEAEVLARSLADRLL